jgi:hypothetical protein
LIILIILGEEYKSRSSSLRLCIIIPKFDHNGCNYVEICEEQTNKLHTLHVPEALRLMMLHCSLVSLGPECQHAEVCFQYC